MVLFLRYVAAIITTLAVSFATLFLLLFFGPRVRNDLDDAYVLFLSFACDALAGCAGLYVGSLCLPRHKRVYGSVMLFIIGTCLMVCLFLPFL